MDQGDVHWNLHVKYAHWIIAPLNNYEIIPLNINSSNEVNGKHVLLKSWYAKNTDR